MYEKRVLEDIQRLRQGGFCQEKIAKQLKISRSTVQRHWRDKLSGASGGSASGLRLEELFEVGKCGKCGIRYPKPKFVRSWDCPGCGKKRRWLKCPYKAGGYGGNVMKKAVPFGAKGPRRRFSPRTESRAGLRTGKGLKD